MQINSVTERGQVCWRGCRVLRNIGKDGVPAEPILMGKLGGGAPSLFKNQHGVGHK